MPREARGQLRPGRPGAVNRWGAVEQPEHTLRSGLRGGLVPGHTVDFPRAHGGEQDGQADSDHSLEVHLARAEPGGAVPEAQCEAGEDREHGEAEEEPRPDRPPGGTGGAAAQQPGVAPGHAALQVERCHGADVAHAVHHDLARLSGRGVGLREAPHHHHVGHPREHQNRDRRGGDQGEFPVRLEGNDESRGKACQRLPVRTQGSAPDVVDPLGVPGQSLAQRARGVLGLIEERNLLGQDIAEEELPDSAGQPLACHGEAVHLHREGQEHPSAQHPEHPAARGDFLVHLIHGEIEGVQELREQDGLRGVACRRRGGPKQASEDPPPLGHVQPPQPKHGRAPARGPLLGCRSRGKARGSCRGGGT
eukprot:RCo012013